MGKLYVIGVGSGSHEDLTLKADRILNSSDLIYCDEKMFEKIKEYYDQGKIIKNEYTATLTRCLNALNSAQNNSNVSIIGSGDTGIYGISSIVLEKSLDLPSDIEIEIVPGIASAFAGAALLGSPLTQDFAVISLSDNLADPEMMKERIINVAKSDFCIVFYSPCNSTLKNLHLAREILLQYRVPETCVGIVSNIGNEQQKLNITSLQDLPFNEVNSLSTIFIGRESTYISKNKRMITPLY